MGHGGTFAVESVAFIALAVGVLVALAMPVVLVVLLVAMPKRNAPPDDPREVPKVRGGRGFPVILPDDPLGPDRRS